MSNERGPLRIPARPGTARPRPWAGVALALVALVSTLLLLLPLRSTASADPAATGFLEICNAAQGSGVSGLFEFTVAGQTIQIPVGACSASIEVAVGEVTITEAIHTGTSLVTVSTAPAERLVSANLVLQQAVVRIVQGDVSTETVATFVNQAGGELKVCKVAGPGVAVGQVFQFAAGGRSFGVPAGAAPGGLCVLVGGAFDLGSHVAITEQVSGGIQVSSVTVGPASRLVGSPDLAAGNVVVEIGPGFTEATFTNRQAPTPAPVAPTTTTTTPPAPAATTIPPTSSTVATTTTTAPGTSSTSTTRPPSSTTSSTAPPTTISATTIPGPTPTVTTTPAPTVPPTTPTTTQTSIPVTPITLPLPLPFPIPVPIPIPIPIPVVTPSTTSTTAPGQAVTPTTTAPTSPTTTSPTSPSTTSPTATSPTTTSPTTSSPTSTSPSTTSPTSPSTTSPSTTTPSSTGVTTTLPGGPATTAPTTSTSSTLPGRSTNTTVPVTFLGLPIPGSGSPPGSPRSGGSPGGSSVSTSTPLAFTGFNPELFLTLAALLLGFGWMLLRAAPSPAAASVRTRPRRDDFAGVCPPAVPVVTTAPLRATAVARPIRIDTPEPAPARSVTHERATAGIPAPAPAIPASAAPNRALRALPPPRPASRPEAARATTARATIRVVVPGSALAGRPTALAGRPTAPAGVGTTRVAVRATATVTLRRPA